MNRSVSSRNLVGGFLGGAVGILASWYISPAALPFGVLLGVLVGWWNEDIVRLLDQAHQQARKTASGFVGETDYVVSTFARFCGLPSAIASALRWIIAKVIVGTIIAVVSAPVRFVRWLASHPMNRAHAIDITTFIVFVLGTLLGLFFLEPHIGIERGSSNRGGFAFLGFVAAFGGSVMYRLHNILGENSELKELGQFYRDWEVISRFGSLGFLLHTVTMQIRYMIGFAVFCTVAIPWIVVMVMSAFLAMMVGFIFLNVLLVSITILRGFYKIAVRSGHWLCLIITMAITSISWFIYRESFADPRILWIVALGTGTISGGITEVARRLMLVFFGDMSIGLKLEINCGKILNDEDILIDIVTRLPFMWFRGNRVARIFRAICFGMPLAQPVQI